MKIKNRVIACIFIFLFLLSSICFAANTEANSTASNEIQNTTSGEEATPEATYQFITSDVYRFDTDISINDIIDGNVFAFGSNVTISGEIGGDVFVCANRVTFSDNAYIHGNIFVLAQDLTFGGIAYDIYGCAANVTLEDTAIIARDIKIASNNITINGSVKRNAYITTSTLAFPEGTKDLIAGDLYYTAGSELSLNAEAVTGEIHYTAPTSNEVSMATKIASYVSQSFAAVLYALVIVLLVIWLAPKFSDKASDLLKQKPLKTFGVGVLASIIAIAFSIAMLLLTYGLAIGISIAAIVLFILIITIAKTIFSMAISKLLVKKFNIQKTYLFVIITLAIVLAITLLGFIPYVGSVIIFIANMFGIGLITFNLIEKKSVPTDNVKEN